jgi:hypothetical protein
MFLVNIYFILCLAMFFVVLWNYKNLPKTSKRLVKQPGDETGLLLIVLAMRHLILMSLFSFFLWPLVVAMELSGKREK